MPAASFTIRNSPADLANLGAPRGAGEFTPSELTTLRYLAWNLNRIHLSLLILRSRVKNETLPEQWVDFLEPLLKTPPTSPLGEMNLQMEWGRPGLYLDFKTMPKDFSLALALFWLPALHLFWERVLRRAAFHRMRRVLPRAWFLSPEDLPPGAVIPGLQLTSWTDVASTNGSFWLIQNGAVTSISSDALAEALREKSVLFPSIVVEQKTDSMKGNLLAEYKLDGERLELNSLTFL